MVDKQIGQCLTTGCAKPLEKRDEILGIEVCDNIQIGFCSKCYTKTSEELSDILECKSDQDFYICMEVDSRRGNDGNIIYSGCGRLYSDIHGKCGLTFCCEDCGEVRGHLDIIEEQMIAKIKSSEFGRAQCTIKR